MIANAQRGPRMSKGPLGCMTQMGYAVAERGIFA